MYYIVLLPPTQDFKTKSSRKKKFAIYAIGKPWDDRERLGKGMASEQLGMLGECMVVLGESRGLWRYWDGFRSMVILGRWEFPQKNPEPLAETLTYAYRLYG